MLKKIQKKLLQRCPQLQNKRKLIENYVSFEFPQRQKKMLLWWEEKIQQAIRCSEQLYLTPSDLQVIFTLEGLKPTPLPHILKRLTENGKLQWLDRPDQDKKEDSWFGKFFDFFLHNDKKQHPITLKVKERHPILQCQRSKVISQNYKNELINDLKNLIQECMQQNLENESIIAHQHLAKNYPKLKVKQNSIKILIKWLEEKCWLKQVNINGSILIAKPSSQQQLKNKNWLDSEVNKYKMRQIIHNFENMIATKEKQVLKIKEKAKQMFEIHKNEKQMKKYLSEAVKVKKMIDNLQVRNIAIKQHLHELQIHQANEITVGTIEQSQQLIKKMMINPERMDEIRQKNIDIQANSRDINSKFSDLVDIEGQANEVDLMMEQLQKQLMEGKVKKKSISVNLASKTSSNSDDKNIYQPHNMQLN